MDEAGLVLSNSVTRGSGSKLLSQFARIQLISNIFMYKIAHELNLLPLKFIESPSLFLSCDIVGLSPAFHVDSPGSILACTI